MTPLGHLDQAVEAHTRGDWAACNSQLRTFLESLFDDIARNVRPQEAAQPPSSRTSVRCLADPTSVSLRSTGTNGRPTARTTSMASSDAPHRGLASGPLRRGSQHLSPAYRPRDGQDLFAPSLLWPLIMTPGATSAKSKLTFLETVYPPISNQEAVWLQNDPEVEALLRQRLLHDRRPRRGEVSEPGHRSDTYSRPSTLRSAPISAIPSISASATCPPSRLRSGILLVEGGDRAFKERARRLRVRLDR